MQVLDRKFAAEPISQALGHEVEVSALRFDP